VRVFILDCAGFVGSRLLGRLLERPDVEVIGMAADYRPVSQFLSHERLTFYGGELPPDTELMQRLVERTDVTVNLLATADARHHRDDVNAILDVDLPASLALARACATNGARLVQVSSGDVYNGLGTPGGAQGPATEPGLGTVAGGPRPTAPLQGGTPVDACALYASGKRMLELGVQTSGDTLGLNYTVLRLFNPVGPGVDVLADWCPRHPAPLFAQLVRGIVRSARMEFDVNPEDVFSYLHVDDAVDCVAGVILDPPSGSERQLYNIGNPDNAITPAELARRIFALYASRLGSSSEATVTWNPPIRPVPGPVQLIPDVAEARTVLGWQAQRSLETILEDALETMVVARRERGRN
jgi:UDP-apiose/xylose synthase